MCRGGAVGEQQLGGRFDAGRECGANFECGSLGHLGRLLRAAASSWSVTLDIALTTTIGGLAAAAAPGDDVPGARDGDSVFHRSAAEFHDDDVHAAGPPVRADRSVCAEKLSLGGEHLGVEQGRSGGAANRVVREQRELPIEQAAGAQAADGGRHAVAAIDVETRLRPIFFAVNSIGCGGALGRRGLASGMELLPGGENLLMRGRAPKFYADTFGVAVFDGDAIAVRGDFRVERMDMIAVTVLPRSLSVSASSFSSSFLM